MTKEELIAEMDEVSEKMHNLSVSMQYCAGFDNEMIEKSQQLKGASSMLAEWAEYLQERVEDDKN